MILSIIDASECQDGVTNNCSQICRRNGSSGYECSCENGYALKNDQCLGTETIIFKIIKVMMIYFHNFKQTLMNVVLLPTTALKPIMRFVKIPMDLIHVTVSVVSSDKTMDVWVMHT